MTISIPNNYPTKSPTTIERLRHIAQNHIDELTNSDSVIYQYFTDGSIDPDTGKSGAAFVIDDQEFLWCTSNGCSMLLTELASVDQALKHAAGLDTMSVVVHTDSKNALQMLMKADIN